MTDYNPDPRQQWRGGGSRTPVKSVVLAILLPLFMAFPLSTFLFVSQEFAIYILKANNTFSSPLDLSDLMSNPPINYLDKVPTDLMITTSIVTAILACVSALGFWELRTSDRNDKGAKHQWRWTIANLIVTVSNLAMVVACTVITFLAGWNMNIEELQAGERLAGTREAWLCALEKWEGDRWVGVGCRLARAGRWSLIPLVICSCALVGLSLWHIGKRGGLGWLRRKCNVDSQPGVWMAM